MAPRGCSLFSDKMALKEGQWLNIYITSYQNILLTNFSFKKIKLFFRAARNDHWISKFRVLNVESQNDDYLLLELYYCQTGWLYHVTFSLLKIILLFEVLIWPGAPVQFSSPVISSDREDKPNLSTENKPVVPENSYQTWE